LRECHPTADRLCGYSAKNAVGSVRTPLADRMARNHHQSHAFDSPAPERLVWERDWPHVTETRGRLDDSLVLNLLPEWSPHKNILKRARVNDPQRLYGFM
jgi:predicted TIM-barrel fold metal-dependent hydrolase